ncbi:MAG TPA: zf-HC2 domain-containing protein, partial [Polyangia bacterium]
MKRLRDDACGFAAGEHPGPDAILGFVLGTLEPGVERALEAHLAGCAACAAALTIEAAREQALWSTSSSWS